MSFGGNELVNSSRAVGYTTSTACGVSWLQCAPCEGIAEALGETLDYTYENIADAPWYDVDDPTTHRFLGVTGLIVEGITDSTRTAEVAESIGDGGMVNKPRHGTRRVRVEATLSAQGQDALEAGLAWLNAALIPRNCSAHGSSCGQADVKFFTACPPLRSEILKPAAIWNDPITNLATNPSFETAGTAVELFRNLATNPSFETTSGVAAVRTNLATNPSFEATTAATVEVRRNLFSNPNIELNTTSWSTESGNTVARSTTKFHSGAASLLITLGGAAGSGVFQPFTQVVGQVYTISVWVLAPVAMTVRISYSNSNPIGGQGDVNLVANTWTQLYATGTANTTLGYMYVRPAVATAVGALLYVDDALAENAPAVGTYFDGSTLPVGDFTHAWTGTANASASVQYGTAVVGGASSNSRTVTSTEWVSNGSKSIRLIPDSTTDSYYGPAGSTGMTLGMVAGKTYTVSATIRLAAPQTGDLSNIRARAITVHHRIGADPFTNLIGTPAPNVVGTSRVVHTFTLPAGTDNAFIRLYNGAALGGGDVWWDDFLLVEGTYTGPYFDGSTPAKVRQNLATRPLPGRGGWVSSNPAVYGTPESDALTVRRPGTTSSKTVRLGVTTTVTIQSLYAVGISAWNNTGWIKMVPGQVVTISAYATASVPFTTKIAGSFMDAAGTPIGAYTYGATTPQTPAMQWVRATATMTAPAGTVYFAIANFVIDKVGSEVIGGEIAWAQDAMYELSGTASEYFDGDMVIAPPLRTAWEGGPGESASYITSPDFTYAWTGTANASTSEQRAPLYGSGTNLPTVDTTQAFRYQTTDSPADRSKVMRHELATTGGVAIMVSNSSLVIGTTYTLIGKVRPRTRNQVLTPRIKGANGTAITAPKDVWTDFQVSVAAGSGTNSQTGLLISAASGHQIGDLIDVDAVLIVEGTYAGGPYFDGTTGIFDPDIVTAWVGTPDASESTRTAVGVATAAAGVGGLVIHSTDWARSRDKSLRLTPSGKSSNASYAAVGGGAGGFRFGMQPDHTYTVMAHLRLDAPQVGVVSGYGRSIQVFFKVDGVSTPVGSAQAPNEAGEYGLTLTYTVPWNATEAYVRLYNGSDDVTDDVWWDDFLFIEGEYAGGYFDGDSLDTSSSDTTVIGASLVAYDWTGTPEASTSTRKTGTVIAVEDPETWQTMVDGLTRYMHTTTAVAGPTIIEKLHRGDAWGYVVEFVLVSAVPWTFGVTKPITGGGGSKIPIVISDTPYNLVPYPSAELTSGTVVVATNYVTNPSVEANGTGWTTVTDGAQITQAQVSLLPSTELAAVGTQSIKALFTATATSTNGWFGTQQIVTLTGITPTTRYSINVWTVSSVESGTAVLGDLEIHAYWRNDAAVTLLDQTLYKGSSSGGATSVPSTLPPAGTTNVIVRVFQRVTSWSTGAKVRVYADALAVTVP